jgi:hypothetical protein
VVSWRWPDVETIKAFYAAIQDLDVPLDSIGEADEAAATEAEFREFGGARRWLAEHKLRRAAA